MPNNKLMLTAARLTALRALHAAVATADAAIVEKRKALEIAEGRAMALDARLAADLDRPKPGDAVTLDLAMKLAADPDADITPSAVDRLKKSRAASADHEASATAITDVVRQASAAVGGEIEAARGALASAEAERASAWLEFVRGGYALFLDEFRERWEEIHSGLYGPLMALAGLRIPNSPSPIVNGLQPQLMRDARLAVRSGTGTQYLLYSPEGGAGARIRYEDALPEIMAALA